MNATVRERAILEKALPILGAVGTEISNSLGSTVAISRSETGSGLITTFAIAHAISVDALPKSTSWMFVLRRSDKLVFVDLFVREQRTFESEAVVLEGDWPSDMKVGDLLEE